jgi:two-component system, chemotaxis family, chemotaxis protein CheY
VALNILVVDDSAVMRAMIIKTLGLSGIQIGEILQAGNGREGMKAIEDHWIDLVLVDINMPVMTGIEMVEQLRANPETKDLAVIVVSTEGSESRIETLRQQGAGFVHKPFTPEILRDKILKTTGATHAELIEKSTVSSDGPDF